MNGVLIFSVGISNDVYIPGDSYTPPCCFVFPNPTFAAIAPTNAVGPVLIVSKGIPRTFSTAFPYHVFSASATLLPGLNVYSLVSLTLPVFNK